MKLILKTSNSADFTWIHLLTRLKLKEHFRALLCTALALTECKMFPVTDKQPVATDCSTLQLRFNLTGALFHWHSHELLPCKTHTLQSTSKGFLSAYITVPCTPAEHQYYWGNAPQPSQLLQKSGLFCSWWMCFADSGNLSIWQVFLKHLRYYRAEGSQECNHLLQLNHGKECACNVSWLAGLLPVTNWIHHK